LLDIGIDIPRWFVPLVLVLIGFAATFPFALITLARMWSKRRTSRAIVICAAWVVLSGVLLAVLGILVTEG